MILEWIEFENIFRFGKKTRIDFPENCNVNIKGMWEGQSNRSNWSGKTSVFKTLLILGFGQCSNKLLKEIPNDRVNEAAIIKGSVRFDTGESIIINRTITDKTSTLHIDGWEKLDKAEAQAKLDGLIGYSYNEFVSSVCFEQGHIHQFAEAKPAAKLELLINWMQILGWGSYEEEAKRKKKVLKESIEKSRTAIHKGEESVGESKQVKERLTEVSGNIKQAKSKQNRLES